MPNPFLIERLPPDSPFCDRREEIDRLHSCAESGTWKVVDPVFSMWLKRL